MKTITTPTTMLSRAGTDSRYSIATGALMLLAICTPGMKANSITAYTYTGHPFTTYGAPFSASDYVTLTFTIPTLLDNQPIQFVTPLSYTASDVLDTLSNSTPGATVHYLMIGTSNGRITTWNWDIFIPTQSPPTDINSVNYQTTVADVGIHNSPVASAYNTNSPGIWVSAPVPEPSSVVLTCTALLALAFVVRKTKCSGLAFSHSNEELTLRTRIAAHLSVGSGRTR